MPFCVYMVIHHHATSTAPELLFKDSIVGTEGTHGRMFA